MLSALSATLALAGVGFLAYPFATDMWAGRLQQGLAQDLKTSATAYAAGRIETGDPLTRLEIPRLGVDVVVVEGTSQAALRAGAGHYPNTPLPGEQGNVAIAGHRTTYGRPFNRMEELMAGDAVILTTPIGKHVYEITGRARVVAPDDWSVVNDYPRGGRWLTLTSCHPEGSADYRIVARARLIRSTKTAATEGAGG